MIRFLRQDLLKNGFSRILMHLHGMEVVKKQSDRARFQQILKQSGAQRAGWKQRFLCLFIFQCSLIALFPAKETIKLQSICFCPFLGQLGVEIQHPCGICMSHPYLRGLHRNLRIKTQDAKGYAEIVAAKVHIPSRQEFLPCFQQSFMFPFPSIPVSSTTIQLRLHLLRQASIHTVPYSNTVTWLVSAL